MKKIYSTLFLLALFIMAFKYNAQTVQTFSYTGSVQTFTVPICVSSITIDAAGAAGANAVDIYPNNSVGGKGGRVTGVLAVTPGMVFNVYVGGVGGATTGIGGYNGGGGGGLSSAGSGCSGGYAGSGGGATDIRIGGIALSNRVVTAGGGGGAGRDYCNGSCIPCGCGGSGGAGGGLTGMPGLAAGNCGYGYPSTGVNFGAGGSSTSGGAGGPGDANANPGSGGTLGGGGAGAGGSYDVAGGGGGGGYYGGGGGGSASSGSGVGGGGGGGGSSEYAALTGAATTPSYQAGNGYLTLSYVVNGGLVSVVASNTLICAGSSINLSASGPVSGYTWTNGSNLSSISISPTSNTIISVSATNSNNCVSVAAVAITVNVQPTLAVTTSTNNTCLGKTVTLTATGANTYVWTGGVTNGVSFAPSTTSSYTVTGTNACGTASAVTSVSVSPLAVSLAVTPSVTCAGSTSTITATAAATSYSWYPVANSTSVLLASPNSNQTYTVAVSDGTCGGNATIALSPNPVPTISALPLFTTVCGGTPITFNAAGGTSYTWYTGTVSIGTGASITVTPNVPTGYYVKGFNSFGCSGQVNVAILANPAPTVVITNTAGLICVGDQVILSASGASTYLWGGGQTTPTILVSPSSTTNYSVTGTASNCPSTETIDVTVFNPTLAITGNTSICSGGNTTLNVSGGNIYTWFNGSNNTGVTVNPTVSTVYSVAASTNSNGVNCPSTASVQVLVLALPTVSASTTRTSVCKNEPVIITASGANTYSWSNGATTSSVQATTSLITTAPYVVKGTAANGCSTTFTLNLKINGCVSLADNKNAFTTLNVFPNPSNGEINLEFNSEIKLTVTNELGQFIKTIVLSANNDYKAKVTGLSSGIYFVAGTANNKTYESKFVVTK